MLESKPLFESFLHQVFFLEETSQRLANFLSLGRMQNEYFLWPDDSDIACICIFYCQHYLYITIIASEFAHFLFCNLLWKTLYDPSILISEEVK